VREASRRTLTLAAAILGSSLGFLDATVVVVALPTIEEDLDLGLSGQQWVFLSYSLALAALYLAAGAVGDQRGRRQAFVWGTVGFAAASAVAGVAPTGNVLIVARALQGVAGAFVTTNALALVRAVYGREAGHAIGLWTAFTGAATIAAAPLGGAIVDWVSWRWIFYINIPLAAAAVFLALAGRCREREQVRTGHLDVPGAVLAAVGFGTLTYGLVEGPKQGFADIWWSFAIAAVTLAAFVVVERRASEPILPFDLFRRRNFAAANAETFLLYGGLYGQLVFVTLYLQNLGFSAFQVGLINVPAALLSILLAPRFGALADRHGPRLYLTIGPVAMGAGALALVGLDEKGDFWTAGVAGTALFSLGIAIFVAPITSTALKSAPDRYAGIASGVNSTVSRVGSLVAVALLGAVISLVYQSQVDVGVPLAKDQLEPALRAASADAFRVAMVITAALAFGAAAIGWLGISDREARE
jgi:EmrB/QacA subfamily drug resistance transporter